MPFPLHCCQPIQEWSLVGLHCPLPVGEVILLVFSVYSQPHALSLFLAVFLFHMFISYLRTYFKWVSRCWRKIMWGYKDGERVRKRQGSIFNKKMLAGEWWVSVYPFGQYSAIKQWLWLLYWWLVMSLLIDLDSGDGSLETAQRSSQHKA